MNAYDFSLRLYGENTHSVSEIILAENGLNALRAWLEKAENDESKIESCEIRIFKRNAGIVMKK
jgi:hypothetical protein